ncbi:DUF2950 domain-containing protein [Alsobacter sp. SYSU M60028]|uniref:DUF2950 domain-containing protein n=1 Tax=Alsobacter ponti TaxID=2962936 RepID=A0ABT1LHZ9_9HYPH|nr:DUF2950 domain-containing protein [Alsobacter ponti]MCP8941125.1 DUF2950 domain-containing protein [Alsobacter ponti]
MNATTFHFRAQVRAGVRAFAALAALGFAACSPAGAQERFPTPEAAAQALIEAAKAKTPGFVDRIFGPGAAKVLADRDPDENARNLAAFNAAAAESNTLAAKSDTARTLRLGARGYDFPVPIVKRGDAWVFDLAAGREEIENRRIGLNELSAIESCRAYVQAQREYYRMDPDGDEVQSYAMRIVSSPGRRDGLYWPPATQNDLSPLDDRYNEAMRARGGQSGPAPYQGYYFRILKGQARSAPGGAYDYVINGRMIAGFALVAYPAQWGKTGVMTFICNQQGRVYQRNLGPNTAKIGAVMRLYDPDKGWTLVE